MRRSGSHLAALVAIPVLFALVYSARLVHRSALARDGGAQATRRHAVLAEGRLLADSVHGELQQLHLQVIRFIERPVGLLDPAIIHVAELQIKDGRVTGVRSQVQVQAQALKPAPGFFEDYLRNAMVKIDPSELRREGAQLIRVSQGVRWVAVAFPLASGNAVLALVDPAEAFPVFKEWSARSSNALDRGYLIGSDGYVYLHSDRAFWGSDFSSNAVFRDLAKGLFDQSSRREGEGVFAGIDLNPVAASWLRIGGLPLAVVIENVMPPETAGIWQSLGPSILILVLGTLGLLLIVIYVLSRSFSELELRSGTLQMPKASEYVTMPKASDYATMPQLSAIATVPAAITKTAPPPPTTEMTEAFAKTKAITLGTAITQLSDAREGLRAEGTNKLRIQDEILLRQYEADATRVRDLRQAASRLTATTARIFETQSLFFAYNSSVQAAILQAYAGFPDGRGPGGMSFPIGSAVLERIFEVEQSSSVAALAEFTPLQRLVATHFSNRGFQAWAVTGFAPSIKEVGGPRLLGVLVLLDSARSAVLRGKPEEQSAHLQTLVRLLKATSLSYENALLTR
jgi:hypothetical protein